MSRCLTLLTSGLSLFLHVISPVAVHSLSGELSVRPGSAPRCPVGMDLMTAALPVACECPFCVSLVCNGICHLDCCHSAFIVAVHLVCVQSRLLLGSVWSLLSRRLPVIANILKRVTSLLLLRSGIRHYHDCVEMYAAF